MKTYTTTSTSMTTMTNSEIKNYSNNYSEKGFWNKVKKYATKAGKDVIEIALILYYEMKDKNVSWEQKLVIISALGYFIAPLDIIPDSIPLIGFTDDFTALMAAYNFIKDNISDEIVKRAKAKVSEWFD